MSLLKDIVNHLREIKQRLNLIENNAKTNEELPIQNPIDRKSLLRVSINGKSETLTLQNIYDGLETIVQSGDYSQIIISGKSFQFIKHPQNTAETLEPNDAIASGWWSDTEFWDSAVYKGGDTNLRESWTQLSTHEEIPLT